MGVMGKKINELVKAVNRLEEKVNEMDKVEDGKGFWLSLG